MDVLYAQARTEVNQTELCRIIELPKIADPAGSLSVVEARRHIPFDLKRIFYVYELPPGAERGGHAHKTLEEVIVCVAGRMEVTVDDGSQRRAFTLDRPWLGLYLPPMVWAVQRTVVAGSVYLVLASHPYDPGDYIRDYQAFLAATAARTNDRPDK